MEKEYILSDAKGKVPCVIIHNIIAGDAVCDTEDGFTYCKKCGMCIDIYNREDGNEFQIYHDYLYKVNDCLIYKCIKDRFSK